MTDFTRAGGNNVTTFNGTGLSDSVRGSAGDDVLNGNGGNDTLLGLEGFDSINGGVGNDFLYQNNLPGGNDGEADTLIGGGGNDVLSLSTDDAGFGGFGDDTFSVRGDSPSILSGGGGEDTLVVAGLDLSGSRIGGIERLEVGSTAAVSMGVAQFGSFATIGAGNGIDGTSLTLTAGGRGALTFDAGLETVSITGSDANEIITVSAGATTAVTFIGGDGRTSFVSGAGDDSLYGGAGADTIDGGAGNDFLLEGNDAVDSDDGMADHLTGGTGDDTILAGANDLVDGGAGNDAMVANGAASLSGGTGNDIILSSIGDDTLDGGDGVDAVWFVNESDPVTVDLRLTTPQSIGTGTDLILNFENAVGSGGDDSLTGTDGANVLEGYGGDDTLDGGEGQDTAAYTNADGPVTADLRIASPQDTGAGTDTFVSIENLTGSAYDDSLYGNARANVLAGFGFSFEAGVGDGGNDLLDGRAGQDMADYSLASARVTVDLSDTGPQATGGAGTDTLVRIEDLRGSAFDDGLAGSFGANRIFGLAGADAIAGGAGDDTLIGGAGADRLRGGVGADHFTFLSAADSDRASPDIIADFQGAGAAPGDVIDLSAIDADLLSAGLQGFTFGSTGESGLSLVDLGTDTLVRGNLDDDGNFEFGILIRDGATQASAYTAADFLL